MGTWALIQIVFNIFLALGLFVVIMRMNRAPKDDPRLSRGLQLLQSKISVLEDLSDRTEVQVGQLTAILDQKCREVQAKVQLAEQQVHLIRVSMDRSLEVAKIFQDKIPHQEIIERQNTIKYVQAARMAHQGLSVDEIVQKVDLPKGEIEFIAKVNRDRLMFSEDQLPWWAKEGAVVSDEEEDQFQQAPIAAAPQIQAGNENPAAKLRAEMELAERQRLVEDLSRLQTEMQDLDAQLAKEVGARNISAAFEVPQVPTDNLQKLGEEFRKACEAATAPAPTRVPSLPPLEQLTSLIPQALFQPAETEDGEDRPVIFLPPEPSADPIAAREAAQAKVQAALRATAPQPVAKEVDPELEAARAMAREVSAAIPVPQHPVGAEAKLAESTPASVAPATAAPAAAKNETPVVINARNNSGQPPVIKKVEFPRIDSTDF